MYNIYVSIYYLYNNNVGKSKKYHFGSLIRKCKTSGERALPIFVGTLS